MHLAFKPSKKIKGKLLCLILLILLIVDFDFLAMLSDRHSHHNDDVLL